MPAEGRLALAANAIVSLLDQEGVDRSAVLALTVGTPGTISPASPAVGLSAGMPGWAYLDVRSALSSVIACDIRLENDANLAVVGERARGVAAGATNIVFLLLGERLGAGIIANGNLIRGRDGAAGELGYVPVATAPRTDPRYGPLEGQVNASALIAMGRAAATQNPESVLNRQTRLTAENITKAANTGDTAALGVLERLAARIAQGVAPAVLTLNPDTLVIGGGISRGGDIISRAIAKALEELVLCVPQVLMSALGDEAVLVGAVAQSLERVESAVLQRVLA
jgi:predicted NBD/HSP70 family sugar kinase